MIMCLHYFLLTKTNHPGCASTSDSLFCKRFRSVHSTSRAKKRNIFKGIWKISDSVPTSATVDLVLVQSGTCVATDRWRSWTGESVERHVDMSWLLSLKTWSAHYQGVPNVRKRKFIVRLTLVFGRAILCIRAIRYSQKINPSCWKADPWLVHHWSHSFFFRWPYRRRNWCD